MATRNNNGQPSIGELLQYLSFEILKLPIDDRDYVAGMLQSLALKPERHYKTAAVWDVLTKFAKEDKKKALNLVASVGATPIGIKKLPA